MTEDYSEINNYSLEEDIGQGNFGKVKLAIYKPTNEKFAIKIINKNMLKIKMRNVIFKENEIITKFNHINVIYVYNIIDTPENYYIVMEYCKKGELFDYIVKHQRINEDEASIFFYQLINGVEYIHSKGIAHRDLKPENILLTEDKILKIIDFGLSHEFNGEIFLKTKCGSPSYASPEIISQTFYDGFKTDIWCCGIILYAMLCGYLPFDGNENEDNNYTLFKNILECKLEFPEYVSDLGKDLIYKILTVDIEKRMNIPEIKNHPFYLKGKNLCKLDYSLIEETIIKKRCYISETNKNKNKKVNGKKNLKIEISDNKNEEDNKRNNYFIVENSLHDIDIKENKLIDNNYNNNFHSINNNDLSPFNKKISNIIFFNKLKNGQINFRNKQILTTDINKFNPNIISMMKISKNFNLLDRLLNTKSNYTKTLEQDKLYSKIYLSTINKEKKFNNNNIKPSIKDILKSDKNLYFNNIFGNPKLNRKIFFNKMEKPDIIFEKKSQNNYYDNKTFNDEIFLRNFRKNLLKREKLSKDKNPNNNNENQKKNLTIDIENKSNRIISLSTDTKKLRTSLGLNDNNSLKYSNIKRKIQNYENNSNTNNIHNLNINNLNKKLKIVPNKIRNNQKYENLSSDKYLNYKNKNKEIYKNLEYKDNNSISIIKDTNSSYINENNNNFKSINNENSIVPVNKQHIYKSENNYKRKGLSLQKAYKKNEDKINLSKLIQNINKEESKKSSIKKNNKSFFNRLNPNHKTIESYSISNRNNTIDNNRQPDNYIKKIRNFNYENKFNEIKNINEESINNKFLKNSRNLKRINNKSIVKSSKNDILPILTENNRNILHYIK